MSEGAEGSRVLRVHVSTHLHAYTGGASVVEVEVPARAVSVAEVLDALERRFSGIRFRVADEQDRLRPHMNAFVGGRLTRSLAATLARGDDLYLLAALSGG